MKRNWSNFLWAALGLTVLGGCALAPDARRAPPSTDLRYVSAPDPAEVAQYMKRISGLSGQALYDELEAMNAAVRRNGTNLDRLRLSMLMTLKENPYRDEKQAHALMHQSLTNLDGPAREQWTLALLSSVLEEQRTLVQLAQTSQEQAKDALRRAEAAQQRAEMLRQQLEAQQKRSDSLQQKNDALQQRHDALQQKLEALKSIETNLLDREKNRNGQGRVPQ